MDKKSALSTGILCWGGLWIWGEGIHTFHGDFSADPSVVYQSDRLGIWRFGVQCFVCDRNCVRRDAHMASAGYEG